MQVSTELMDSLSEAKTRFMLAKDQHFSATVMLNLHIDFSESVPTAATNGLRILVNPSFWEGLTKKQRVFLLAHETWHVCFDHMGTRGNRDHTLYNMACDYMINYMIVRKCDMEFIQGGLLDDKFADMSSYEIYDIIKDDPAHQEMAKSFENDVKEAGEDEGEGQGKDGEGSDGMPSTGSSAGMSQEEVSQKIQDLVMQATVQAEMSNKQGEIPAELQRRIQAIRNPELPWQTLLMNYFTERTNEDYSWSKRNRRHRDVYLPSLCGEGMGAIRAYFDASGSITQKELGLQCAELKYIKELMNPSRMVLRAFSHYMGREQCFDRDSDIEFDCDAGGGTELQQVMDDIAQNDDTEVVIIFTDGEFNRPDMSQIGCDVIWVIVNDKNWKCRSGHKVIHMTIENRYG